MNIIKSVLAVCVIGLCSIQLHAQKTEMERNADAAIRKGNYEEAVNQLEAFKAYRITEGVSENSQEILRLSKTIAQAKNCREASEKADKYYSALESAVSEYSDKSKKLSLLTSDGSVYSSLRKLYQRINNLSKTAADEYSSISSIFPADNRSKERARESKAMTGNIVSPESALETVFLEDATEQTLKNYLAILNPDASTARQIREDFTAWNNCRKTNSLEACDYYIKGNYHLFRNDVKKIRVAIVDEQNRLRDENLWNATDKTSKESLFAYLNADTGEHKAYKDQADSLYRKIEEIELAKAREREAWERLDKNDKFQLQAYLRDNPNSGYAKEINNCLRNIAWAETDKDSAASLRSFISEWPRTMYTMEAEAYLNLIDGRKEMAEKNYQEAYSLYAKAAKVLVLSDKDSKDYAMLKSIEAQRLEDEREMSLYTQWENKKTLYYAQSYVASFPTGKHAKIVNNWIESEEKRLEKENEYREKCEKIEKRTRISYDYERFSAQRKASSYEDYYTFLKSYERQKFGSSFQISCGANAFLFDIGSDADPDHISGNGIGAVAGMKIGKNSKVVNFHFGCEFNYLTMKQKNAQANESGTTTDDDFDTGNNGATDGTGDKDVIKTNVWDYSPYALVRLNCSTSKGGSIHFDLGGGYGITTHTGYGQFSMGFAPRKWIDFNTYIRLGASNHKIYGAWGAQLLFYIF